LSEDLTFVFSALASALTFKSPGVVVLPFHKEPPFLSRQHIGQGPDRQGVEERAAGVEELDRPNIRLLRAFDGDRNDALMDGHAIGVAAERNGLDRGQDL
jgi:hypothetical protein